MECEGLQRWCLEEGRRRRTGTVRYDAVAHFAVAQPAQGVEGAADFEGADALVVLAFEEEVHLWSCGRLALERGADEGLGGLRRRGEVGERSRCQDWGAVDVWFDS